MEKSNMDVFNECAAKVFDFLYSEFPKESEISLNEIVEDPDDKEQREIFFGTMRFLEKEGYLTYQGDSRGRVFLGVVLTSMGLAVLGATLDSLKGTGSFIQKIRDGLKTGGKEAIKTAIQGLINYSVTAAIKQITR